MRLFLSATEKTKRVDFEMTAVGKFQNRRRPPPLPPKLRRRRHRKISAASAFRRAIGGSKIASPKLSNRRHKKQLFDRFFSLLTRKREKQTVFLQKCFICEKTDNGKNVLLTGIMGNNYEMKISQSSSVELGNFLFSIQREKNLVGFKTAPTFLTYLLLLHISSLLFNF